MKTIKIIVLCVSALFATKASAMDGNELKELADAYIRAELNKYTSKYDVGNAGKFVGYIGGVIEAYPFSTFCQPQGVTQGQQFAIVTKYLNDNPAKLHLLASELIFEAMAQAEGVN